MKYIQVLTALVLISCRSTSGEQADLSREDLPYRIVNDQEAQLPDTMWSPMQRKATASYHYLVGEYKVLSGDIKGAQPLFESAYNLDPNPFLAAKVIASDAVAGNTETALVEAKRMTLLYPKSARVRYLYAHILARRGLYKEAISEYEVALKFDPQNEQVYMELSDLHLLTKQMPKAIEVVRSMVKNVPSAAAGWTKLGCLYLISGDKKAALVPAQRGYDLQSSDPEAVLIYALALEANNQSKTAVALYEALYRQNPANEELIARMIGIYRSMGNLATSLELLNDLSKLPGGSRPGIQLQRAIILWELKDFAGAATILTNLAKEFPEQMRLKYFAGLGEERMQRYAKALEWYSAVASSSEFWLAARIRMAIVHKEMGNLKRAKSLIKEVLDSDKADDDAFAFAAAVYAEERDLATAIALMKQGFARFPKKTRLLFLKGVYEEQKGDIEASMETMNELVQVDPNNSQALNFLGYIYAERGERLDEAEQMISKALQIKPGDGYYLDSLAWVYYKQGQYQKAQQILEKLIIELPGEGVVLAHLAAVYAKVGKLNEAIKLFEKALGMQLSARERAETEANLQEAKRLIEDNPSK